MAATIVEPRTYSLDEASQALTHYFLAKKFVSKTQLDGVLSKFFARLEKGATHRIKKEAIYSKSAALLQEIGFQIRVLPDLSKERQYVCYSVIDDTLSKDKHHTWSKDKSQFFWKIVKNMFENLFKNAKNFEDEDLFSEYLTILRDVAETFKPVKCSALMADSMITEWIQEAYFEATNENSLTLGVRTIVEMDTLLQQKFNLQQCSACKCVCFVGRECEKCSTIYHEECIVRCQCLKCNTVMGEQRIFIGDQPSESQNENEE